MISQMIVADKFPILISSMCDHESNQPDGNNDTIIQYLVTLPDRAANRSISYYPSLMVISIFISSFHIRVLYVYRFSHEVPSLLSRASYNSILFKSILFGLHSTHTRLSKGLSSSITFISRLVGKMCLHGYAIDLWSVLLSNIMVSGFMSCTHQFVLTCTLFLVFDIVNMWQRYCTLYILGQPGFSDITCFSSIDPESAPTSLGVLYDRSSKDCSALRRYGSPPRQLCHQ